jgi:hypothetical protein
LSAGSPSQQMQITDLWKTVGKYRMDQDEHKKQRKMHRKLLDDATKTAEEMSERAVTAETELAFYKRMYETGAVPGSLVRALDTDTTLVQASPTGDPRVSKVSNASNTLPTDAATNAVTNTPHGQEQSSCSSVGSPDYSETKS